MLEGTITNQGMELLNDVFVQPAAFHTVKLRLHGFVKLNLEVVRWSDQLSFWQHYTAWRRAVKGQAKSRALGRCGTLAMKAPNTMKADKGLWLLRFCGVASL